MLIDYNTLRQSLAPETLDSLVREFLIRQVGDEGFDQVDPAQLDQGMARVHQALKKGELMVEYSEHDESVAIRPRESVTQG